MIGGFVDAVWTTLPPALRRLLQARFPEESLALRGLYAPHPSQHFRSMWDDRHLWQDPESEAPEGRRARLGHEAALDDELLQIVDRTAPYFPAPGTGGDLRSPYPELSDAEFWCFVTLWRSVAAARRELEAANPYLEGKDSLRYLRDARHDKGALRRIWRTMMGAKPEGDPRVAVFQAHLREIFPNHP